MKSPAGPLVLTLGEPAGIGPDDADAVIAALRLGAELAARETHA